MQLTTYLNRLMCTVSGLTHARMQTRRTTEARKSAKLATEALNSANTVTEALNSANTVTLRRVLCVWLNGCHVAYQVSSYIWWYTFRQWYNL